MTGFLVTMLARALCFVSLADAEVALRRGDPRLLAVAVGSAVASGAVLVADYRGR